MEFPTISRPDTAIISALAMAGSAMCSAELHRMGYRNTHLEGIHAWTPGQSVVGPALTLKFMPIREDVTPQDARVALELVAAGYWAQRTGRPSDMPIAPDHPVYRSWLPDEAAA